MSKRINHIVGLGGLLAAALLLAMPAQAQRPRDWNWGLEANRYKEMNLFERAQYDKATGLFQQEAYRAAASEFEKFKIQFPESNSLSHVIFMMGYSLHLNRDRHKAIQTYVEVLDYFGDTIADAAPAIYFLGIAHLDNGDDREGLAVLKEMVDDQDYQKHPLAAGALRRLADNEWRNNKHQQAIAFWKQVVRDFHRTNQHEANQARDNVTDYYIKGQNYAEYEAWLINDDNRDNANHRKWVAQNAWNRAWGNFHHGWGKYTNFNRDEKTRDMRTFHDWFKAQKLWYDQTNDAWTYYHNAIYFASQRLYDRKETRRLIDESMPLHQAIEDEKARNERYAWLADRMREGGDWDSCLYCIGKMTDTLYAGYKRYEMHAARSQWKEALEQLVHLENANNQYWSPRALSERARILKDVLRRYEEAITLYRQIANPPHNLWAIQECFKNWGKLADALTTLTEIENSFPDQASRAAWHKASYLHEAGQSANAIAQARRILNIYPKSRESSLAHQLLEQYGVDTGGGVIDEE